MDITDEQLLQRALNNLRPTRGRTTMRWVAVMDAFALGSTYAHMLCIRFGLDPDAQIKR